MFTKEDSLIIKGWAILIMIFIHLFGFKGLPYFQHYNIDFSLYVDGLPLVMQLTKFGAICIYIYIFISGYGLYLSFIKNSEQWNYKSWKKIILLYANYWIVLSLFIFLDLSINKSNLNIMELISNVLCIDASYNREWWFLFPYALLLLLSKHIFEVINRLDVRITILLVFSLYCMSQLCIHQYRTILMNDAYWLFLLLNTCNLLLGFVIGALFAKYNCMHRIRQYMNSLLLRWLAFITLILIIVVSIFIPSLGLQPFYMIIFVSVISSVKYFNYPKMILRKLGVESTNMWFIHTFFIYHFFTDIIYISNYALIVYALAVLLSYIGALIVRHINEPIQTLLIRRFNL